MKKVAIVENEREAKLLSALNDKCGEVNRLRALNTALVEALRKAKDDVRAMEWTKVDDDGRSILVRKADVLEIIADRIERALEK